MRIVHLDYVMVPPVAGLDVCVSRLEGTVLSKVPVIRVFGATPSGQKACCHIHKVRSTLIKAMRCHNPCNIARCFPTCTSLTLMTCRATKQQVCVHTSPGIMNHSAHHHQPANAFMRRMAAAIDTALATQPSANGEPQPEPQQPQRVRQTVFGVQLVRAMNIYGYHAHEQPFVKIMLCVWWWIDHDEHDVIIVRRHRLDPAAMTKTATVLQSGCILGRHWQPFEAHIPYLLQFKVDMNLAGMGWLHLDHARFRAPLNDTPSSTLRSPLTLGYESALGSSHHQWNAHTIPAAWQWVATGSRQCVGGRGCFYASTMCLCRPPQRQSVCELELDTSAEHIKNRQDVRRCCFLLVAASPTPWVPRISQPRNTRCTSTAGTCATAGGPARRPAGRVARANMGRGNGGMRCPRLQSASGARLPAPPAQCAVPGSRRRASPAARRRRCAA